MAKQWTQILLGIWQRPSLSYHAPGLRAQVYKFPSNAAALSDHPGAFLLLAIAGLLTSFTSTVMFTAGESCSDETAESTNASEYCHYTCTFSAALKVWPFVQQSA